MIRVLFFCAALSVTSQTVSAENMSKDMAWRIFVKAAGVLSAKQNGGSPITLRGCDPAVATCSSAVIWKLENGSFGDAVRVENSLGITVSRQVCVINDLMDVRHCKDFDTGREDAAMKNSLNQWIRIPVAMRQ